MRKFKGISLFELVMTSIIISVISSMAISSVFRDLPAHKVSYGLITAEQALKIAKSTAAKTSSTIIADFSQATSNNGDNGGLIRIIDSDGTVLKSYSLNKNVVYNSSSSTIAGNQVYYDYRGQPVDSSGDPDGFVDSSNTVAISYNNYGEIVATKVLSIEPVTGNIDIN